MNQPALQIRKIAFLIAAATVLQIIESFIPSPFPGVRLGLANMITLIALANLGFVAALEIALLRTILSSFLLGTFLSPTFFLSFFAALSSTLVMGLAYRMFLMRRQPLFSLVSVSVLGAMTHNGAQIALVYFFLIKHQSILFLLPWLLISAVLMGWLTGIIACQVCRKLGEPIKEIATDSEKTTPTPTLNLMHYHTGHSLVHKTPAILKLALVIGLSLLLLFTNHSYVFGAVGLVIVIAMIMSGLPFKLLFSGIGKMAIFILLSFLLPVLFIRTGEILIFTGPLQLTQQGLLAGSSFALRIGLLVL